MGSPDLPRTRGDRDDAAPAALAHPVDHRPGAVEDAVEVEIHVTAPALPDPSRGSGRAPFRAEPRRCSTRMSTGPTRSSRVSIPDATASASVTSKGAATARPEFATIRRAVSSARCSTRSFTATEAPCRASSVAIPAPAPCPAPVTSATLPGEIEHLLPPAVSILDLRRPCCGDLSREGRSSTDHFLLGPSVGGGKSGLLAIRLPRPVIDPRRATRAKGDGP